MRSLLALLMLLALAGCISHAAAPGPYGHHVYASYVPYPNPQWNVLTWYIDPGNSSGCASPQNNGQSSSCGAGGAGPLLHFYDLLNIFTTYQPTINQATPGGIAKQWTINVISDWPDNIGPQDPLIFDPLMEPYGPAGGSPYWDGNKNISINFVGTETTVQSGLTLSSVTAKNINSNQPLTVTFSGALSASCGTAATECMLVNNTHASRAWAESNTSGNTWVISQPFSAISAPVNGNAIGIPTMVDTWASSDSITVVRGPHTWIAEVVPRRATLGGTGMVTLLHLMNMEYVPQNADPGNDGTLLGTSVNFVESVSERMIEASPTHMGNGAVSGAGTGTYNGGIYNSQLAGGFAGGDQTASNAAHTGRYPIYGGGLYIGSGNGGNGTSQVALRGAYLDGNVYVRSGNAPNSGIVVAGGYNNFGAVELESTLTVLTGVLDVSSLASYSINQVWGGSNGIIDGGRGQVLFPAGAGKAAATFTLTGGLQLAGFVISKFCVGVPSQATLGGCAITLNATNIDSNLGANNGCAYHPGGGAFCNTGL